MTRAILTVLLILLLAFGLTFVGYVHFVKAETSTQVGGIISQDTTWTKANSPYNFAGDAEIINGVTLSIEAGTIVNLYSYGINVDGTLYARGNSTDNIRFNGGLITFTKSSTVWSETARIGCLIENAILNMTQIDISSSPKINNNTITFPSSSSGLHGEISIPVGSPIISNNIMFVGGNQAIFCGGSAMIVNNTIIGGFNFGIELEGAFDFGLNSGTVTVSKNIITDVYGVNIAVDNGCSGTIIIQNNFVEGVIYVGLELENTLPFHAIIQNNTILTGIYLQSNQTLVFNNILHNDTSYSVYNRDGSVNASYNWWGTTNTNIIEQSIINKFTISAVNFTPFLTSPNLEAPPIPTNIIYPTPSPTQQPTKEPSPAPTGGPYSGWILLAATALVLVIIVIAVCAVKRVRSGTQQGPEKTRFRNLLL